MWTCPKCQHQFVNKNQWHSCGKFSEQDFIKNKSEEAKALYGHFISTYRRLCNFKLHPVKTRVALLAKMRFASVNRLGKHFLDGHLVFHEAYTDTLCFHRVEMIAKNQYVHHFRLKSKEDITEELKSYMKKACLITGARVNQKSTKE